MSEFYQLRRIAIKDLAAYCGFLSGFLGSAPFAWGHLAAQLEIGQFARGLWYFLGITSAAGLFGGIAGLALGFIIGWIWEHAHRQRRERRANHLSPASNAESQTQSQDAHGSQSIQPMAPISLPPRLRLVASAAPSRRVARAELVDLERTSAGVDRSSVRESESLPVQPELRTSRLVLRPFTRDDAALVESRVSDRRIADTTLSIPHPYPPGAAEIWIDSHVTAWNAGTGATYAAALADHATVVGAVSLALSPDDATAELGYWIAVPYWNRGFCTEASSALLDLAFGQLRINRVQARHLTRNPASGRVMQKLGMRPEGVHRQAVRKWDRYEDIAMYSILAVERMRSSVSGGI